MARALSRIILNDKILGIQVFDTNERLVSYAGAVEKATRPGGSPGLGLLNELVGVDFAIDYEDEDDGQIHRVGRGVVYTGASVAFDQVKYGFFLIIINSVVKTAALWFITVFFINKLIERPLAKLEGMTRRFEPSTPHKEVKEEAGDELLRARKDQVGRLMVSYEEM